MTLQEYYSHRQKQLEGITQDMAHILTSILPTTPVAVEVVDRYRVWLREMPSDQIVSVDDIGAL